jgi:hypothetical protein
MNKIELFKFDDLTFCMVNDEELCKVDPEWKRIRGCWGFEYMPANEVWLSKKLVRRYHSRVDISQKTFLTKVLEVITHEYIEIIIAKTIQEFFLKAHDEIIKLDKNTIFEIAKTIGHTVAKATEKKLTFVNSSDFESKIKELINKKKL